MTNKEFFNIGLPKWPALLVVGKPVTKDQAKEILIRTSHLSFSSNDHKFNKQLNEFFFDVEIDPDVSSWNGLDEAILKKLGLTKEDRDHWTKTWEYTAKYREEVKQIPLEYLTNSRIVSSWIGGPHGWCDWNGNIGCHNYNIGKYPSVEEVYNEWKKIAKAFPFLELTCQLCNHEASCEDSVDNPGPAVEFRIKNGKVKMYKPTSKIANAIFGIDDIAARFSNQFGERGCTIEQFMEAVVYTKEKVNGLVTA